MSATAGIVRLDGGPFDRRILETMAARMARRASSETNVHAIRPPADHEHGIAAVAGTLATDSSAAVSVLFDGRLHNRAELAATLRVSPALTDSALALQAFLKWNSDAASHLLGDFAFAAWEAAQRRLTLARDPSGIRPLYYRISEGWIGFASAIDVLAVIPPMPSPNEGMVAEFLTAFVVSTDETVFNGIMRLPPGFQLVASGGKVSLARHWTPNPDGTIRYQRDDEYESHLRELLDRAIAARIGSHNRAGVLLSGGVDSSSVAIRAAKTGQQSGTAVESFSISISGSADERPYFEAVAGACGIVGHRFDAVMPSAQHFRRETERDLDIVLFPNSPTLDTVRARAKERGVGVMLTGMGGDDWLGSSFWALADLIRTGRWRGALGRARSEARADDFPGWQALLREVASPFLSLTARQTLRTLSGRARPAVWMEPAFVAAVGLDERLARRAPVVTFPTFEQQDIWYQGTHGTLVHAIESTSSGAAWSGVEHAHPFFDRRIIEFGLALPPGQRWRDGRAKDLLRRAMSAELPKHVVARTANPAANHALVEAIAAESDGRDIEDWSAVKRGWVRARELRDMHDRMMARRAAGEASYGQPAWILWSVLATSLWLDAATGRRGVV